MSGHAWLETLVALMLVVPVAAFAGWMTEKIKHDHRGHDDRHG